MNKNLIKTNNLCLISVTMMKLGKFCLGCPNTILLEVWTVSLNYQMILKAPPNIKRKEI